MGKGKTCPPGSKLASLRGQLSRARRAGAPKHPQISILCCLIRQMRDLLKIILPRQSSLGLGQSRWRGAHARGKAPNPCRPPEGEVLEVLEH